MDRLLKLTQPRLIKEFDEINNTIQDDVAILGLTKDNLYNSVSTRTKKRIESYINSLKELGVYEGFCALYIKSLFTKKMRNIDALEIMILGAYMSSKIMEMSKDIFLNVAEDIKIQAEKEMPFKIGGLDWATIEPLTVVPTTGLLFFSYLYLLFMTNSQEALKSLITSVQSGLPISLEKLMEKQRKRILSVHDDKHSGALHDTCVALGNKVYISPLVSENHKVRFMAVVDQKTTDMCLSLDGQIFNTVDENKFTRYTQSQGEVEITVKGLVDGVNLPPITDFTHHCRSTLVYEK